MTTAKLTELQKAAAAEHRQLSPDCYSGLPFVARLTDEKINEACTVIFGSAASLSGRSAPTREQLVGILGRYPGLHFAIPAVMQAWPRVIALDAAPTNS